MEQPKAYKSSIDPKKPQPTMSMDTRQTHYQPRKPIDFNNKIPEYKPNNQYYKTSFWDAPKRKLIPQPRDEKPKDIPAAAPKPKPKLPPPRRAPPTPKPVNNSLQPLPQPNLNSKKQPAVPPVQPREEPHQLPRTPPPAEPQSRQYPVQHLEPEEPDAWSSTPPPARMQQWGEPTKVIPDLNPGPLPPQTASDFSTLPSTVGSMSRMMAMFT